MKHLHYKVNFNLHFLSFNPSFQILGSSPLNILAVTEEMSHPFPQDQFEEVDLSGLSPRWTWRFSFVWEVLPLEAWLQIYWWKRKYCRANCERQRFQIFTCIFYCSLNDNVRHNNAWTWITWKWITKWSVLFINIRKVVFFFCFVCIICALVAYINTLWITFKRWIILNTNVKLHV